MAEINTLLRRVSFVFWFSYIALLVEIALNTFVWHQEGRQGSITIWLIRSLPLLAFMPWLLRRNHRAMIWLCFLLLLYFLVAVPNAMSPIGVWINHVEAWLVVVLFVSSMMYSRWIQRAERERAADAAAIDQTTENTTAADAVGSEKHE